MNYRERRHRSVEILGRAKNVTAWRQRDWNFECPERGAKRRGVVFGAVASIPPNLKSKSGASPPIFGLMFPPLSGSTPSPFPFGLRFFLPPLHGPISPFFPFLCTPLPYTLSPFLSTFPPPILVPSSSLFWGVPHPARWFSQPSSVSSPADPGRAWPTNGLWTAFWGQNSYSGDND